MSQGGARLHIVGIVQGVGFRPFVFGLAQRYHLTGWVRNSSAGVDIEIDGEEAALASFVEALGREAPPLARIDALTFESAPVHGFSGFEIVHSEADPQAFAPVSPDVSICADCLAEMFDANDRRYRYPFINCTNCGPRFTIIKGLPYDRPETTMADFPLCADCAAEYVDPLNRRFHAQPVACAVCGPQVWLELPGDETRLAQGDQAIAEVQARLRRGQIAAVRGLGGFHLACDATNAAAVAELRRRKLRVGKPFAIMAYDQAAAEQICSFSPLEVELLTSRPRPIVIARRLPGSQVGEIAAPGQNSLGVMLPYTPLHYLLLKDMPPLVMTSGNLSEEPICTDNDEARQRLAGLADVFLMHDRDIYMRIDDSVVRAFPALRRERLAKRASGLYPIRRARGYAPDSITLPIDGPQVLAAGAELKNTFCLTRERYAFLSHHIGDLENYETLEAYEAAVTHYEKLFHISPQVIGYDLHPDYLATRYAQARAQRQGLPAVGVQHHHAHIAACMVDNGLDGSAPVLGVALDGTGYGPDGAVWGGEFLVADYRAYQRAVHLAYAPLPGGDRATREPWRMALAWLRQSGIAWDDDLPPVRYALQGGSPLLGAPPPLGNRPPDSGPGSAATPAVEGEAMGGPMGGPMGGAQSLALLDRQLALGLNTPLTSSMGRLFDAAAACAGVRQAVSYEAQAAIEFEALVYGREPGFYPYERLGEALDPAPMFRALVSDLRAGVSVPVISTRFHAGVARMVAETCDDLHRQTGLTSVVLSGGVWQNMFLLTLTVGLLQEKGLVVYVHRQVPTNDGGLALGQAAIAMASSSIA